MQFQLIIDLYIHVFKFSFYFKTVSKNHGRSVYGYFTEKIHSPFLWTDTVLSQKIFKLQQDSLKSQECVCKAFLTELSWSSIANMADSLRMTKLVNFTENVSWYFEVLAFDIAHWWYRHRRFCPSVRDAKAWSAGLHRHPIKHINIVMLHKLCWSYD